MKETHSNELKQNEIFDEDILCPNESCFELTPALYSKSGLKCRECILAGICKHKGEASISCYVCNNNHIFFIDEDRHVLKSYYEISYTKKSYNSTEIIEHIKKEIANSSIDPYPKFSKFYIRKINENGDLDIDFDNLIDIDDKL